MSKYDAQLTRWYEFVETHDVQVLTELLAEDAIFRSPVVWKPKEGRAAVVLYLTSAVEVLKDFKYHRIFTSDDSVGLEFTARVGELTVKGIDLIQFNQAGKIIDFEVLVRPASALQALGAEMGRQLALRSDE